MQSVSGNYWDEIFISKRIIDKVRNDLNFSEFLSKLIISRQFDQLEIDSINQDIQLINPFLSNKDFKDAKNILDNSLTKNEKILVIGDYDVDGCISTSLLVKFFKLINKKIHYYIPNRYTDGYGASLKLIKKLVKKKPELIIMVDCGSNSNETIKFLNELKIKTLIIDHHEIYSPYPKAKCLINPKKKCDYNELDYFCSSSLVYFFIDYFLIKNKLDIKFTDNLIYVLLATICDVMPLRKINRLIAINELKKFDINKNYLFKQILSFKKIKRPFEVEDLGFLIGPILNVSGRINDANIVVKLLTTSDNSIKDKIIKEFILLNEKRKIIENESIKEINFDKIIEKKDNVLVEHEYIINEGLIGIIASRLKDYFNKPTIILTKSTNGYKASARSTLDFNIGEHIKHCIDKKIIISGGGHNLAAGFLIQRNNISKLQNYMNNAFIKNSSNKSKIYLSKISLNSINEKFYNDIKKAGPFGNGNINPYFLIEKLVIINPKIIKNKFINFFVKSKSGKLIPGVSFNLLESQISKNLLYFKKEIDLIVQIKENYWNNKKNLQLIVKDLVINPNKA